MTALDIVAWNLPALFMGFFGILGTLTAARAAGDRIYSLIETLREENARLMTENAMLKARLSLEVIK